MPSRDPAIADSLDLSGPWLARHDPGNIGRRAGWHRPRTKWEAWKPITLPAAWQSVLGADVNGIVWLARSVELPARWGGGMSRTERAEEHRYWLSFYSVATDCTVFVNGVEVGRHVGDYVPFQLDVTDSLGATDAGPTVFIALRVDQMPAPRPPKGAITELGHIGKGFHDVLSLQHGGAWGPIHLERARGAAVMPDGVGVRAEARTGRVDISVELARCEHEGSVQFTILDRRGEVVGAGSAALTAGAARVDVPAVVHDPELWSPEEPILYTLHLALHDAAGVGQRRKVRFGFRHVEATSKHILLNGSPTCLRGVLHWGHEPRHGAPAPTPEQVRAEFAALRERGFNCVCLCMVYMPRWFYEIADETGMLLWQEHPVWKSPMGDEHIAEYQRLFEAYFRRDRNHPSVILVSGSCEHEAFNEQLASWWWKRSGELIPDKLRQQQTAFFPWLDPSQTELFDEHTYDNSGRWVYYLREVQHEIARLPRRMPFVMGETIIANNWPDVAGMMAEREKHKGEPAGVAGIALPETPWWITRGLDECAALERWITERYGEATLARFRADAGRFALTIRKFQSEQFRSYANHAGWVMNHIRDVPAGRCGFMDDLDRWRLSPEQMLPWLGEAPILISTPDELRGFVGGRKFDVRLGVSNFSRGVFRGAIEVRAGEASSWTEMMEARPGEVAWTSLRLEPEGVERPTRMRIEANAAGLVGNAWDVWVLPERGGAVRGVYRMDGLPFEAKDRELEFEEKGYSSGWGLKNETWRPVLPETAELLPECAAWRHDAELPRDCRVIVTHRLTRRLLEFMERGGRVVELASRAAGGFNAKTVMLWGQAPLVIEEGPLSAGDSEWVVDLLHHDLTRRHQRAVPTSEMGIAESVDPIVRLVYTHDSGRPRMFDALFATRVGEGMLVVSSFDHTTAAGGYVLGRVIGWAGGPIATARGEIGVERASAMCV